MAVSFFRNILLVLIAFACVAATYVGGIDAGLDRAVPERYRVYGIPIALSSDVYGLKGYVADREVVRRFMNQKPVDVILAQDLPAALPPRPANEAGADDRLFFVPADDKGDVTFTRIAFALFGRSSRALYDAFFLLLAGSVLAYVVAFVRSRDKLLVGIAVLLALFSLLSAFQDGLLLPYVVTFYDVRIFSVLAALAVLHLAFASIDPRPVSAVTCLCAIYQALLVTLAIHVRSSSSPMVIALVAWIVAAELFRRRGAPVPAIRYWPVVVLAVSLGGLSAWERLAYHPRYFRSHLAHHLFWHNVGIGFALHPALGAPIGFVMSDEAMINRVARYLLASGHHDTIAKVFGPAYSNPSGTVAGASVEVGPFLHGPTSDLALYDAIAGRIVRDTMRAHPLQSAALFAYYKPRYLIAHVLWFSALTYDQPSIAPTGRQSPLFRAAGDTRRRHVYWTPITLLGFGFFAGALATSWPRRPFVLAGALAMVLLLLGASVVPLLIAYPAPLLMGEPLLWLACALYMIVALAAAVTAARTTGGLKLPTPRSTIVARLSDRGPIS